MSEPPKIPPEQVCLVRYRNWRGEIAWRLRRPTQEALEATGELVELELQGRRLRDHCIAHRSRVEQVAGERPILALRPLGPSPVPRTAAGLLAEFDAIIAEAPVDFLGTGESTRGANYEEVQWRGRIDRFREGRCRRPSRAPPTKAENRVAVNHPPFPRSQSWDGN